MHTPLSGEKEGCRQKQWRECFPISLPLLVSLDFLPGKLSIALLLFFTDNKFRPFPYPKALFLLYFFHNRVQTTFALVCELLPVNTHNTHTEIKREKTEKIIQLFKTEIIKCNMNKHCVKICRRYSLNKLWNWLFNLIRKTFL